MSNKIIRPVTTGLDVHKTPAKKNTTNVTSNKPFDQILNETLNQNKQIKFSKHALERLSDRHITLTESEIELVENAIDLAKKKGIKDSLILMEDVAFVANVDSSTIITAIDKASMKEKVFTNIDGAVSI